MITIPKTCQREIRELPGEIRADLADALARLDAGLGLAMPLSRPMPSVAPGVHELRLKNRTGQYRIVYAVIEHGAIAVLHALKKTTDRTPQRSADLARRRLREVR